MKKFFTLFILVLLVNTCLLNAEEEKKVTETVVREMAMKLFVGLFEDQAKKRIAQHPEEKDKIAGKLKEMFKKLEPVLDKIYDKDTERYIVI